MAKRDTPFGFVLRQAASRTAVIVSYARTPIGRINGSLASKKGSELGAVAVQAAVARAGLTPDQVEEVILGNVVSAGMGQAPARQAAIYAGLPESVCCTTVNKVCASGMKTIMLAAQQIMLGQRNVVVCGGFESMSNIPYYALNMRAGARFGHQQMLDGLSKLVNNTTHAMSEIVVETPLIVNQDWREYDAMCHDNGLTHCPDDDSSSVDTSEVLTEEEYESFGAIVDEFVVNDLLENDLTNYDTTTNEVELQATATTIPAR